MAQYDVLIRNCRLVRPGRDDVQPSDVGIRSGRFAAVEPHIDPTAAEEVIDGAGLLAFPGVVDCHQHWGIYNPLEEDVRSESRAAAQGGVTAGNTYIRTGQYYLNKGGLYRDFIPEVLERSEGRAHIDYSYSVAPMMRAHLDELEAIAAEFGMPSFKAFMFYGGHGLHGKSDDQSQFLMTPPGERYDVAHFEFVMRALQQVRERQPGIADFVQLALHCETAEIMRAYTEIVEKEGGGGLEAYSRSRPPHSEGLAVTIAAYLAHATGFPNINLVHLSSAAAVEAAMVMADAFPEVNFRREVTIGHLLNDLESTSDLGGKVNPPVRPRADVEALWDAVKNGWIHWVVSDHACCREDLKYGPDRTDVFKAKAGFGGTEYILPGMLTEASRRNIPLGRVATLLCKNPAERFGFLRKGDIATGYDADLVLVRPDAPWTVAASLSESSQEYTHFEGIEMTHRIERVWLRGKQIVESGSVIGSPQGRFVRRPTEAK